MEVFVSRPYNDAWVHPDGHLEPKSPPPEPNDDLLPVGAQFNEQLQPPPPPPYTDGTFAFRPSMPAGVHASWFGEAASADFDSSTCCSEGGGLTLPDGNSSYYGDGNSSYYGDVNSSYRSEQGYGGGYSGGYSGGTLGDGSGFLSEEGASSMCSATQRSATTDYEGETEYSATRRTANTDYEGETEYSATRRTVTTDYEGETEYSATRRTAILALGEAAPVWNLLVASVDVPPNAGHPVDIVVQEGSW